MKFGVALPHYLEQASAARIQRVARAAEELGFDSVWVSDHVVYPDVPELAWANTFFEPLAVLSHVAAITQRVQLGTSVLVAPHRNPIVAAKTLATIDVLSGGRLLPCFGTGGIRGEFEALGLKWEERGPMTDEYIKIMRELWGPQPASYQGRFVSFTRMKCSPKPLQSPLPVWVGGNTRRAIRRAVELGDGWHPIRKPPEVLEQDMDYMKSLAARMGRSTLPELSLRLSLRILDRPGGEGRRPLHGNLDEITLDLHKYAHLGVSHLVLDLLADIPNMAQTMERFVREIRPLFVS